MTSKMRSLANTVRLVYRVQKRYWGSYEKGAGSRPFSNIRQQTVKETARIVGIPIGQVKELLLDTGGPKTTLSNTRMVGGGEHVTPAAPGRLTRRP